jgi:hypothetical protein
MTRLRQGYSATGRMNKRRPFRISFFEHLVIVSDFVLRISKLPGWFAGRDDPIAVAMVALNSRDRAAFRDPV